MTPSERLLALVCRFGYHALKTEECFSYSSRSGKYKHGTHQICTRCDFKSHPNYPE